MHVMEKGSVIYESSCCDFGMLLDLQMAVGRNLHLGWRKRYRSEGRMPLIVWSSSWWAAAHMYRLLKFTVSILIT